MQDAADHEPLHSADAFSIGLQENYVKLKRDAEANEVLLLAVREQLAVRSGELAQCQLELAEQKGRCSSMEISMNTEVASRDRTERELKTAYLQRDAIQGQLDRSECQDMLLATSTRAVLCLHPDSAAIFGSQRLCLVLNVVSAAYPIQSYCSQLENWSGQKSRLPAQLHNAYLGNQERC